MTVRERREKSRFSGGFFCFKYECWRKKCSIDSNKNYIDYMAYIPYTEKINSNLTNDFVKKTQKTPKEELLLAKQYQKDFWERN